MDDNPKLLIDLKKYKVRIKLLAGPFLMSSFKIQN